MRIKELFLLPVVCILVSCLNAKHLSSLTEGRDGDSRKVQEPDGEAFSNLEFDRLDEAPDQDMLEAYLDRLAVAQPTLVHLMRSLMKDATFAHQTSECTQNTDTIPAYYNSNMKFHFFCNEYFEKRKSIETAQTKEEAQKIRDELLAIRIHELLHAVIEMTNNRENFRTRVNNTEEIAVKHMQYELIKFHRAQDIQNKKKAIHNLRRDVLDRKMPNLITYSSPEIVVPKYEKFRLLKNSNSTTYPIPVGAYQNESYIAPHYLEYNLARLWSRGLVSARQENQTDPFGVEHLIGNFANQPQTNSGNQYTYYSKDGFRRIAAYTGNESGYYIEERSINAAHLSDPVKNFIANMARNGDGPGALRTIYRRFVRTGRVDPKQTYYPSTSRSATDFVFTIEGLHQ